MRAPIGCDRRAATEYLGCTPSAFEAFTKRGIVRSLRKGWYAYADLDAAIETLRRERDMVSTDAGNTIRLAEADFANRRTMDSERDRPGYTTPKELLRP